MEKDCRAAAAALRLTADRALDGHALHEDELVWCSRCSCFGFVCAGHRRHLVSQTHV